MKSTIIFFSITLVAALLMTQCEKKDPIETVDIQDQNFLNALFAAGVDANGDGLICACEAEKITDLIIYNEFTNPVQRETQAIRSLAGIESFKNLESLNCGGHLISNLDLGKNIHLVNLLCWDNVITSLDVSNNIKLESLDCYSN